MPTKAQVEAKVYSDISLYSGISLSRIRPEHILADPPIQFADPAWNSLALSLRAYVRHNNGDNTVRLSEVKKKGLRVQDLCDLIYSRV